MSLKDQIIEAMWDRDMDRLYELAQCNCCCDEHTSSDCLARLWGGCRGGYGSKRENAEEWAAHYDMPVEEFYGGRPHARGGSACAECGVELRAGEEVTEYGRGAGIERYHYPRCPPRRGHLRPPRDDDEEGFESGFEGFGARAPRSRKCCRCGDKATVIAHDYGTSPGTPYCYACRRQVTSGSDMWPYNGIAWGAGPKNGRKERTTL